MPPPIAERPSRRSKIGKELGVRYLLEGVVRWAKDGAGVWRARVTPTLVDTKAGTIKWTGTPVDVTLDDPFTAQGNIATDVAQAMQIAVLPAERATLRRRFTDNPQAFAAYQRAQALVLVAERESDGLNPTLNQRAIRELDAAIALDASFGDAWGALAGRHFNLALGSAFANPATMDRSRVIMRLAKRHAPTEPRVLMVAASWATFVYRNRAATDSLVREALTVRPNDATLLSQASGILNFWDRDRARVLAERAARLDPRSTGSVFAAAMTSLANRHWDDTRRYGEAVVSLDSTTEAGWYALVNLETLLGDTVVLQRLGERVLRNVRAPSATLACNLAFGGRDLSAWYLNLSAAAQRVATLSDSACYYDCKTDAALRLRGRSAARHYSDSIIALLPRERVARLPVAAHSETLLILAFAYANAGERASAAALLACILNTHAQSTLAIAYLRSLPPIALRVFTRGFPTR